MCGAFTAAVLGFHSTAQNSRAFKRGYVKSAMGRIARSGRGRSQVERISKVVSPPARSIIA
jgi:hypothetical protein